MEEESGTVSAVYVAALARAAALWQMSSYWKAEVSQLKSIFMSFCTNCFQTSGFLWQQLKALSSALSKPYRDEHLTLAVCSHQNSIYSNTLAQDVHRYGNHLLISLRKGEAIPQFNGYSFIVEIEDTNIYKANQSSIINACLKVPTVLQGLVAHDLPVIQTTSFPYNWHRTISHSYHLWKKNMSELHTRRQAHLSIKQKKGGMSFMQKSKLERKKIGKSPNYSP